MVAIKIKCQHCGSQNIVRNGRTSNDKQRYLCRDCGRRSREHPQPNGYTAEERAKILRAYRGGSSLPDLQHTFGVSRNTVIAWLNKSTPRSRS